MSKKLLVFALIFLANTAFAGKLTVKVTGDGTVTSSPVGINGCQTECSFDYPPTGSGKSEIPQSVILTATSNSIFKNWNMDVCTPDVNDPKKCTVVMDADKTVTVTFTAAATPAISVTPDPLPTFSATTLSQKVTVSNTTANTTLKVSSAVLSGTGLAKFSKTTGCENAQLTTNTCEITVNFVDPKDGQIYTASLDIASDGGNKSVSLSATSSSTLPTTYKLSWSVSPTDAGIISCKDTNGNACNSGSEQIKDSTFTLTATANSGYNFKDWTNCTSFNSNVCTVKMNEPKTITATFSPIPPNPNQTVTCTTGEVINNVCISTSGLSKLGSPLMIGGGNNPQTATATFFGGVAVDGQQATSAKMLDITTGQTISVDGLIVPQHQGVADVIAVGLYVPTEKLTGRATAQDYCDWELGNFYMNTADEKASTNNYCFWISKGSETTLNCNPQPTNYNVRRELKLNSGANVDNWKLWNGHIGDLKPMYSGVSLDSVSVNPLLLYADKPNYTGQVCLYFGYRLTADQTLVFNGEPIIFRVSQ
ncbi:MAG: hypothetical protein RIT27_40 [Pseudomonadota bacterium]|jgi:hypothetical protein